MTIDTLKKSAEVSGDEKLQKIVQEIGELFDRNTKNDKIDGIFGVNNSLNEGFEASLKDCDEAIFKELLFTVLRTIPYGVNSDLKLLNESLLKIADDRACQSIENLKPGNIYSDLVIASDKYLLNYRGGEDVDVELGYYYGNVHITNGNFLNKFNEKNQERKKFNEQNLNKFIEGIKNGNIDFMVVPQSIVEEHPYYDESYFRTRPELSRGFYRDKNDGKVKYYGATLDEDGSVDFTNYWKDLLDLFKENGYDFDGPSIELTQALTVENSTFSQSLYDAISSRFLD